MQKSIRSAVYGSAGSLIGFILSICFILITGLSILPNDLELGVGVLILIISGFTLTGTRVGFLIARRLSLLENNEDDT